MPSRNSRRARPVPPGICHLVGPGGGEFIRKPLPRGGPFVNSSRSGLHCSFFSIFHFKICLFRYFRTTKNIFNNMLSNYDKGGFRSITTLHHSYFAFFCLCLMKLLPAIVISSYMEERQSMHRLKSLKGRFSYMAANWSRFSKHLMTGSSLFSVNFTNGKNLAKPSHPSERKGRFPS